MTIEKKNKELRIIQSSGKTKGELESELKKEGYSCYVWSDSPGAYYSPHSHAHDECICVISGEMLFFVDNKEYKLNPGQKLYLPSGTVHEASNKASERVTYLVGEKN